MVLYYNPHSFNMFASRHNSHISHPGAQPTAFAYSPQQAFYAAASLQNASNVAGQSSQGSATIHYGTSQTSELSCSPTGMGIGTPVNTDPSVLQPQTAPHWHPAHSVYPVSAPSAAAVHASACARVAAAAAAAAYEDWGQQNSAASLSGSPCPQISGTSQSPGVPPLSSSTAGGTLYTYGPALQVYRGTVSSPTTMEAFSPAAHLTDATAHPSPDSGLTISSDGMGEDECQQHSGANSRPQPLRSPFEWMKKPSYQSQPSPGKTRTKDKYRVVYSDFQRLELEKEFHYSRYITIRRKCELAAMLGLSDRQVKIWFQNRRAKERKQTKKREEMMQKEKETLQQLHTAHALNMMVNPGKSPQSGLTLK